MAELSLNNISLNYVIYGAGSRSVVTAAKSMTTGVSIRRMKRNRVEVAALDDVTLNARDGDRIGVLGHNGAGKTTLLKVAAGIFKPTAGKIRRVGRIVSIINPSVGLNPILSGHENIAQIALLYGLGRREIEKLSPEIEEFTELGEFLDLPVESYSAGMVTRLAFGVATAFRPEILVADENIGTGDARFIEKAEERMHNMMDQASLLLLASHSIPTIKKLCNRAILMEHGKIVGDGDTDEVIEMYESGKSFLDAK